MALVTALCCCLVRDLIHFSVRSHPDPVITIWQQRLVLSNLDAGAMSNLKTCHETKRQECKTHSTVTKPYPGQAQLLEWPGLMRGRKKGRWTDMHLQGLCWRCSLASDGVRCGVASRARAIIPAARALLVVAAPQK